VQYNMGQIMVEVEKGTSKIFNKKQFVFVVGLVVFVGLTVFIAGRSEQDKEVSQQVEALLVGDCEQNTDCVLTLVYPDGTTDQIENDFFIKEDTPAYLFPDGRTLAYKQENNEIFIEDIIDKTRHVIPDTYQASFLQKYSDSFWISNGDDVELYDLGGNQKVAIKKSLLPLYSPGGQYFSPPLSPLYSDNRVLAYTVQRGEGYSTTTLWEIFPNRKATKIESGDEFYDGFLSDSEFGESVRNYISFLHSKAGFLVVTEYSNISSSRSEAYRLYPDGTKDYYTLPDEVAKDLSYELELADDDKTLFYSMNGYDTETQSRTNYVFKYDLETGELSTILEYRGSADGEAFDFPLRINELSPSGEYMSVVYSLPNGKRIMKNFYSVISVRDKVLKRDIKISQVDERLFGWIKTGDLK
jgi:hypothetical protein